MVRYHIVVHGRVQGVGFRYYTLQQAKTLGVRGWVKNNLDGTVEIDAQATKDKMDRFLSAVKKGSPHSRVEHLDVEERKGAKSYKSFQVKY